MEGLLNITQAENGCGSAQGVEVRRSDFRSDLVVNLGELKNTKEGYILCENGNVPFGNGSILCRGCKFNQMGFELKT